MKKKEPKKGLCAKCNDFFYIHDHHILPKSIFGKKGKTVPLCPKCHAHVHAYLDMNTENPNNEEEIIDLWEKWLNVVKVVVTCLILLLSIVAIYQIHNHFNSKKTNEISLEK